MNRSYLCRITPSHSRGILTHPTLLLVQDRYPQVDDALSRKDELAMMCLLKGDILEYVNMGMIEDLFTQFGEACSRRQDTKVLVEGR